MSASESETVKTEESAATQPYKEYDQHPTQLGFDRGGVPLYVALIWVVFLASYVAYMVVYGLPDLTAWGAP